MIRVAVNQISRSDLEFRYRSTRDAYRIYMEELADKLLPLLQESGLKFTIRKRMKSFDSYFAKVMQKARELNGKGVRSGSVLITDLIGIRIICPFLEDILKVEYLIRQNFEVVERERKGEDYSPQEFGYESTHVLVRLAGLVEIEGRAQDEILCEVQIRTNLQDAWAEVEHELMYKAEFTPFDEPLRRKLAAVNANLSLSDIIFQEIRDYQRQLYDELKKRRHSFLQKLQTETEDLLLEAEEKVEARADLAESAVSPTVETIDVLLLEALTAHNTCRYPEAIEIYSRILARHPKKSLRAMIYIHRGMAYFGNSLYMDALEDFSKSMQINETNARAYYYRGVVYRFLQDLQHALSDFDRCLEIDPYQFDPLYARAQVYFSLGDYVRAHEDCSRALAIKPEVVEAQRFLEVITRRLQF